MGYDIYFVRRDPGQSFEDALDELEESMSDGETAELTDNDLEVWELLLPRAREILGDVDVTETDDDTTRELVARDTGIELTLVSGELEIHVPSPPPGTDDLELMSTVYELARAVEEATGLEGYDPQVGEPVSAALDEDVPPRPPLPTSADDDDDQPAGRPAAQPQPLIGDARPDMAPDAPEADEKRRRWWEFWRS